MGRSEPHDTRSFDRLPDLAAAASLLAELATAPCRFSPVAAEFPMTLYGAGNMGRLARDFLKAVGRDFTMVIDRDARRIADGPDWRGVRLCAPADVSEREKKEMLIAVSVANSPYVPIERELQRLGFENIVPFYDLAERFRHLHPLSNGWFAPPLSTDDRRRTERVLTRWDDDVSRAHHLQFLAWRRLREEWTFAAAPICAADRFFIPEVLEVLDRDESFIDAGAHHGSVIEDFVRRTGGRFRRIIAVEPDPANRACLEENLNSLSPGDRPVTILDCALGEREGDAMFHDGLGYASQIAPTGRMRVTVRSLDTLGLEPTFIKLHLEGGELAALKGARTTLFTHRPIVVATVYHNEDGIWKTADWLRGALSDYRFLFRAHSWCGTGAVVYAIPNERTASK